jgi:hypothetical protein
LDVKVDVEVDSLYVKRIAIDDLVSCVYIVRVDLCKFTYWFQFKQKIIKLKTTILFHFLGDYMILTIKNIKTYIM